MKKKQFTWLYAILLLVGVAFTQTVKAQSPPLTYTDLGSGVQSLKNDTVKSTGKWYKWVADTGVVYAGITLKQNGTSHQLAQAELYTVSGGSLVLQYKDTLETDTINLMKLYAGYVSAGDIYIHLVNVANSCTICTVTDPVIQIDVQNVMGACAPVTPCDLVRNGNFESEPSGSTGCGATIENSVDCWITYQNTADVFRRGCTANTGKYNLGTNTYNSVPTIDSRNGAPNNTVVGLVCVDDPTVINPIWSESVQSLLTTPLTTGRSYQLSFWAYSLRGTLTDGGTTSINPMNYNCWITVGSSIGTITGAGAPLYPSGTNIINRFRINTVNNWAQFTYTFTYSGAPNSNLLIGHDFNQNLTDGYINSFDNQRLFVAIDDVSLTEIKPISISPNPNAGYCLNAPKTITLTASNSSDPYVWQPMGITSPTVAVSPTVTTTYTVTSTNAAGCTRSAVYTVNVIPPPTTTIAASPSASVCPGSSVTLSTPGLSFSDQIHNLWSPCTSGCTTASLVVTPTTTTTYTVKLTSANGCTNTAQTTVTVLSPSNAISITGNTLQCSGQNTSLSAQGGSSYTWSPGGATTASISVNPTVTTTYTVNGTYACGTASAVITLSVIASPTVTASASPTVVCPGNSSTLTAGGATSYTWNPGSLSGSPVTVNPSSTTQYIVTGKAANGCTNTATVTVTVNPQPTLSISGPVVSCTGININLIASGGVAGTYTWMPCTGTCTTTLKVFTPTVTTTYTLLGQNSFGCIGSVTKTVIVNPRPTITVTTPTICPGATATLTASGGSTYYWEPDGTNSPSMVYSPSVTTVYSLTAYGITGTGTNTTNCYTYATGTINVVSPPTISVGSTTVCSGSSSTVYASGANSYTWTTGCNTNSCTMTPTATTVYTVTGQNAGCASSGTGTMTVVPALPGSLTINTSSTSPVIANGTGTNVVNLSSSITNTTGLYFEWYPSGAVTPTTAFNLTQPEVIQLNVYNNYCGTSLSSSICLNYVAQNCGNSYTTLNNATLTNTASLANGTYFVTGTLTINWTTPGNALENKTFIMATGSKVEITPTSRVTFNNMKFYSCDGMWQGIELKTSSASMAQLTISGDNNSIEDAYRALYCINPGSNQNCIIITEEFARFNKNYIDIYIENTQDAGREYSLYCSKTKFLSQPSVNSPGDNLKCSGYYSPSVKSRSFAGVYGKNAGIINLNASMPLSTNYNQVQNKDYGFSFDNTNATVCNANFYNAVGVANSYTLHYAPVPTGVGVYSKNSGYLNVKHSGSPGAGIQTTFDNVGYGVITNNTYSVDVQDVGITASSHSYTIDPTWLYTPAWGYNMGMAGYGLNGVFATNARDIMRVNSNTITDNYFPVTVNYTVAPGGSNITSVAQNTISTAIAGGIMEGVAFNSAVSYTPTTNNMRIAANTFSNVTVGVKVTSTSSGLRISNNTFTLNTSGNPKAIYIAGSNAVMADNNSIYGALTGTNVANYNVNHHGVLLENSPGCKIQCNTISNVGIGAEFRGGNSSSGDGFYNNTLQYPIRRGLWLTNGGIIGTQGSSGGASNNQWTGSWPAPATADPNKTSVGGTLSGGSSSDGIFSILYVHNNSSELPNDNYFTSPSNNANIYSTALGSIITTAGGSYTSCPATLSSLRVLHTGDDNLEQRDSDFVNYIHRLLPGSNSDLSPQDKFMLKQYMFDELNNNPSSEPALQNFMSEEQSSSVGNYHEIDSLLAAGNINAAGSKNAQAPQNNDITQTQNAYNTLYMNGINSKEDLDKLSLLADLCPQQYGTAVYQARALLQTLTFASKVYTDSCYSKDLSSRLGYDESKETSVSSSEGVKAKLYPNPNSGTFMLAYDLKTNNDADVSIIDITGKTVFMGRLDNLNNVVQINITNLQSGIYFVQLSKNKSLLWTDKLMISK